MYEAGHIGYPSRPRRRLVGLTRGATGGAGRAVNGRERRPAYRYLCMYACMTQGLLLLLRWRWDRLLRSPCRGFVRIFDRLSVCMYTLLALELHTSKDKPIPAPPHKG